jgi:succinoglycan biosynthesis transport protein ExoP
MTSHVMEGFAPDLSDYVAILRRRKFHLVVPLIVIMFVTLGIAFGLPPVYQATASILIEQQEVPQDLVRSTVTSYASERIQVISKHVLTRENLWAIVKKYNLYPEQRKSDDRGQILSTMIEDISVEMVSADVIDPRSGRSGKADIAFDISFENRDPAAAQKVVTELVSLYLNENVRLRTQKASEATNFLAEEANRLSKHIGEMEAELAAFKEKNEGKLPELMQMNMSLMQRTERELEASEQQITSYKERKIYLESQLAQLEPNTGQSPEGRLRELQTQYLRASATYAPDHPDIIRMKREIKMLQAQLGIESDTSDLENRILQTRTDLAAAREKYSEDHPDVIKLEKTLDTLTQALKEAKSKDKNSVVAELEPDNPAYISTRTQLETAKVNLQAELKRRDRLKQKLAKYEDRLTQTPRVEQEGVALRREYESTVNKYHDIRQKQLQAQVAQQLEQESKGERFSLIEAPVVPTQPVKPNRLGILLLGTVLSMGGGLGLVSISEFFDRTLRGSKAVAALLKAPPIAVIPYIKNQNDLKRARSRQLLIVTVLLIALLAILLIAHLFWMPLDVLWVTMLTNIGFL